MQTLKMLLAESNVISLQPGQQLYSQQGCKYNMQVYFVLFGRVALFASGQPERKNRLCRVTCGWTLQEELVFADPRATRLEEVTVCDREACLISLPSAKLNSLQKKLLADSGLQKDYFVIESCLKGDYLIKQ